MDVAEETLSFQDNVRSQCCERNCVIGELYSHLPPYFPDATWVRWHQSVFGDIAALNVRLNYYFQNSLKGVTSGLTNALVSI